MNLFDETSKKIEEMSELAKVRMYGAAKVEFERLSHQRKAMDELAWLKVKDWNFHHVASWMIVEAYKADGTVGFFLFDKDKQKSMGEYYQNLPVALIALAEIMGGQRAATDAVLYAARVLNVKVEA